MPATLKSRLSGIADELHAEVSKAVKESAELVRDAAKANAPYDETKGPDEPHLRTAIHVERRGPAEYAVVAGDGGKVFYGHIVEHGSAVGGHGRRPLAPRPFLVPALEASREAIIKNVARAIDG